MKIDSFKGWIFFHMLRMLNRSWKISVYGQHHLDNLYSSGEPFLVGFWHGRYTPVIPLLKGYRASVISSDSVRGEVIGEICKRFGYESILLSDRPTRQAFLQLKDIFAASNAVGTAMDGPLGPLHIAKPGIVFMASQFDMTILPVAVSSSRKIIIKKRWDKFEIPLPFAKVALVFGDAYTVEKDPGKHEIRRIADNIGKELMRLENIADEKVGTKMAVAE